ncbi:MAG: hypothetical protein DLM53_00665 [Candidatus Eremiobacter antarcticus]|nr:polysulfide reductase NrfD [Candidatus Eremiobacteraeota bacterium]MBC5809044.1 polysulfide reductase NrfD [Candidatus Eremiobacteraeota bacterium]PZR64277.1 MAG: hypothetical protein DLM53_00665 [Candidatus Eremiobacter sp. RRmetagenome_bin22]
MAEHFVQAPQWHWYILFYFFLAGLAGGSYTLATMLRLFGADRDQAIARMGFLIAFPLAVICGILLTVDLGQPFRFWHMLVNTTPGEGGPSFKYWSPISLGSWVLLLYSIFTFVSFLEALRNRTSRASAGVRVFNVIGSILALFIASYTGVVLSVSNQPVWSDTWTLGALFLASALSGSAALLSWFAESRSETNGTKRRLLKADGYFALLELALIVMFFLTLAGAGTLSVALAGPWSIIWILVLGSLMLPIAALFRNRKAYDRATDATMRLGPAGSFALIVIAGIFLMRLAIIFSAQSS